jgi:beta-lactamase class A
MPAAAQAGRMTSLRTIVPAAAVALLSHLLVPAGSPPSPVAPAVSAPVAAAGCAREHPSVRAALRRLEEQRAARVGLLAVDTGTGRTVRWRAGQRFPFASTIKALAAAAVLDRLTERQLERRVRYTEADLVDYSPVTSLHVADGMTVREVVDAAITVSDNTAGNLLVGILGGPAALERALAGIGDRVTSVDRIEPDLNTAVPGDPRDTTTPAALVGSLRAYLLGGELDRADSRLLERTMRRTTTGDALVRAVTPDAWRVGDKTGSAAHGTRNDLAVLRPPGRAPVLLAVLTTHADPAAPTDDALVAAAARVALRALRPACPR